jgi:hypothetical protein
MITNIANGDAEIVHHHYIMRINLKMFTVLGNRGAIVTFEERLGAFEIRAFSFHRIKSRRFISPEYRIE